MDSQALTDYFAAMANTTTTQHTKFTPDLERPSVGLARGTQDIDLTALRQDPRVALTQLGGIIAETRAKVAELEEIERQLSIAVHGAESAVTPSLRRRIIQHLHLHKRVAEVDLIRSQPETSATMKAAIRDLSADLQIGNVGTGIDPVWVMFPGVSDDVRARYNVIYKAIRQQPRSLVELMDIAGGTLGQTSGAIVALQHSELVGWLHNYGNVRRAYWHLIPR